MEEACIMYVEERDDIEFLFHRVCHSNFSCLDFLWEKNASLA